MKCLLLAVLLLPVSLPSQQELDDPKAELEQIEVGYREAHRQWLAAHGKARNGGVPRQEVDATPPTKTYVDRSLQAARRNAGTERAVPFLSWVLENASDERTSVGKALDQMLADHVKSSAWSTVLERFAHIEVLVGGDPVGKALDRILADNPHPEVQDRARFARGLRRLLHAGDDDARAHAAAELEELAEDFADQVLRDRAAELLSMVVRPGHRVIADDHALASQVAQAERKLLLVNFTGHVCMVCRTMERDVFQRPAVAGVLAPRFVESRLHVDVPRGLAAVRFEANKELQQGFQRGADPFKAFLAGPTVIPMYVIVDASTGRPIRMLQLRGAPDFWERDFVAFLKGGSAPR